MNRPFVAENTRERKRLRTLVSKMTDVELNLPLTEGWTIASALAHLAFWDQRALVLLRKWQKSGVAESPSDTDATNDALLPLCLAIAPRIAANLAVSSAETIDRELEKASPDLIKEIEGLGDEFRLYRSKHRKLHLDEIESALQVRHGKT
ncbi:MAG: maleylpyruvate isomerase N-terminal domain-containing protein [Dehalococcoidales bacterium]|nr:maleylpyruvate isomerase N-terminal domain-containing protein [Dehalococcoidales bacterium]